METGNDSKTHFHNTINIAGDPLMKAEAKAISQEEAVLEYFKMYAGQEFTPAAVHISLIQLGKIKPTTPITSIRRAISNLTNACKLEKTKHHQPGAFNMPNLTWKYAGTTEYKQTELFK